MRAVILDAADARDALADALRASLAAALRARGDSVESVDLSTLNVPPCRGDFGCWAVTPGRCVQPGPHRAFPGLIARTDLLVYLTRVTFGGYSSRLKAIVDHSIPVALPLMIPAHGETHHPLRSPHPTELLVIGLAPRADDDAARVFERLAERNALNLSSPRFAAGVATARDLPDLRGWVERRLERLARSAPRSDRAPLDLGARPLTGIAPRRAVLLVGSPRGKASVSMALARRLGDALTARGLEASTIDLHRASATDPELRHPLAALREADVAALLSPLYVDSLPAPVMRAFEVLAPALARAGPRTRLLAVLNCGFPEASQNDTALAIVRCFAAEAGLEWIGGVGIGGGGLIPSHGRIGPHLERALDEIADAVSRGEALPPAARELARRPRIPAWLYRRVGNWEFRREARRHGVRLEAADASAGA